MKRVLVISPHFPPVNAADMQRIRHTLPYLKEYGWEAEVIAVDPACIEVYSSDDLLNDTVPEDVKVHHVQAYDVHKTRKFGLGSLSMRSFFHYKKKGNELLRSGKFDLVYFTTTAFHVMALGRYWKRKFGVPFILDIQDPWRNDFYLDKPKNERPPKFWLSYNIDKYLELYTMKSVGGIISVSQGYVDTLLNRYSYLKEDQFRVIPFGYSTIDFDIMSRNVHGSEFVDLKNGKINIAYVGRGGHDMKLASECFFTALHNVSKEQENIENKIHCWFVGTSYAKKGAGKETIKPIANKVGVGDMVTEITDRIPFFETLYILKNAQALFVPGSTDKAYTASKIYQYILAENPLLAIFYEKSSVVNILRKSEVGTVATFDDSLQYTKEMVLECELYLKKLLSEGTGEARYNQEEMEQYSAKTMTERQVELFNKVADNSR